MKTITMKLANASEKDLETVHTINGLLNDLDECNRPFGTQTFIRDVDGEWKDDDPARFDRENGEHCKIFVERLLKLLNQSPGCTNRVIWGFQTARDNDAFDKDNEHLSFHPDILAAKAKAEKYDADVAELNARLIERTEGMLTKIAELEAENRRLKNPASIILSP